MPSLSGQDGFSIDEESKRVRLISAGSVMIESPQEGLWSVATGWEEGWPSDWHHVTISKIESQTPWTLVHGKLELPGGTLHFRDAYLEEQLQTNGNLLRVVRRFEWHGKQPLEKATLAIRWQLPNAVPGRPFLPGILYYGNPAGAATNPAAVIVHRGEVGDRSICEEHRYTAPLACVEWELREGLHQSAALHTLPTPVPGGNLHDQWWSLGIESHDNFTELLALSGACAMNGQNSMVKATQGAAYPYADAWMTLEPGAVVEKTFFIQSCAQTEEGSGFIPPLRSALNLHGDRKSVV
jgi:hypothetical protein